MSDRDLIEEGRRALAAYDTDWAIQHLDEVLDELEQARARITDLIGVCDQWDKAFQREKYGHRDHRAVLRARIAELEQQAGRLRALANEWANQPNDYDEDTEQQIADGRTILAILDGSLRGGDHA